VDLVADLQPEHVAGLVTELGEAFYLDELAIREAVERRSTFNLIHLGTLFKVDVFVAGDDLPTRRELERRQRYRLASGPAGEVAIASPEDIVIQKLHWYRLGDHVSDRQWGDALNVLEVRGDALNLSYMRDLAKEMNVLDLLERALGERSGRSEYRG
jgi:hypothetical protein